MNLRKNSYERIVINYVESITMIQIRSEIVCHMEKSGRNARDVENVQKTKMKLKKNLVIEIWGMEGIFLNHIAENVE